MKPINVKIEVNGKYVILGDKLSHSIQAAAELLGYDGFKIFDEKLLFRKGDSDFSRVCITLTYEEINHNPQPYDL